MWRAVTPATLMNEDRDILLAICMGAVFWGAMTYIGNAPNFIVKAMCEEHGAKMPSFAGYILWSSVLLLPMLVSLNWIFIEP